MQYTSDNMTTIWLNVYNQVYNNKMLDRGNVDKANKKAIELANKTINQFPK